MSKTPYPIYLTQQRKRWCLSQEELGVMLGTTKSAVCKFEALATPPSFNLVLATQVLFDLSPREAFPELFAQVHEEIMRRAVSLDEAWRRQSGAKVEKKLSFLEFLGSRIP